MASLIKDEELRRAIFKSLEGKDPNITLQVGLFFVVHAGPDILVQFPPEAHVLLENQFERPVYGDVPVPVEQDYFLCPFCGEKHLRECFDGSPPVVRVEKWVEYYVELPQSLWYQRVTVPPEQWEMEKDGRLLGPRIEWKSLSEKPVRVDGWFLMHEGQLFGYELINRGSIGMEKGATLVLTPTISFFG